MNKKRILGIAALLAVFAMCLTFTACPKDEEERSVTFVNKLKIPVSLSIKGGPNLTLPGLTSLTAAPSEETVTKKGEDIILQAITFGHSLVDNNPNDYVILSGTLIAGEKKGKAMQGVSLAGGTLVFEPDTIHDTAKIVSFKIGSALGE